LASETDPQLERLRQYISRWDGPTGLKDRVLGLTSMAATPSTTSLLTKLKSQGLETESQIKVWHKLRPKIAHGNVIDYADEKLWQSQKLLIAMFHRVILRARLKRCARALFPVTLSRWNAADRTTVISPMPNGAAWRRLFPPPNTAGVPPNTLGVRS